MIPAIVMKAVKPGRMKLDAVRLEMLSVCHTAERDLKREFEKTSETWEEDVHFQSKISLKGGPSVEVWTDNEIWNLVNRDTGEWATGERYPIIPKEEGKHLWFQKGYKAKTRAGWVGSRAGGKFGHKVRREMVMHPGHEGRRFSKTIAKEYRPKFRRLAEKALRNASIKIRSGAKA